MRLASCVWLLAVAGVLGGCKHKPCGALAVDTSPLTPPWADAVVPPDGATRCNADVLSANVRMFDVPATAVEDAQAKWQTALTAKSWQKGPATKEDVDQAVDRHCELTDHYHRPDGLRLDVAVSICAEGTKGLSNLTLNIGGTCVNATPLPGMGGPHCTVGTLADACQHEHGQFTAEGSREGLERCKNQGFVKFANSASEKIPPEALEFAELRAAP